MKKQNFIKGSVILILSAAAAKILGALFKIPLASMLGGTGMGYFSSAYGLFLPVYSVFVSGLSSAASIITSEAYVNRGAAGAEEIKKSSLKLFASAGTAGTLLILAGAYPFSVFVLDDRDAFFSLVIISPSVLFGCITSVYRGYFEGMKNMYPTAFSQLTESAVRLAAGLALGKAASENYETIRQFVCISEPAFTAAGAVSGVTLASFAGMIHVIAVSRLSSAGSTDKAYCCSDSGALKKIISVSVPVAAGALISNLASVADLVTIMKCSGASFERNREFFLLKYSFAEETDVHEYAAFAYGAYSGMAVTVYNIIPSFTNVLGKSLIPHISQAWIRKDKTALNKHVNSVLKIIMLVSVPCGLGICILSDTVLNVLFPGSAAETAFVYSSLAVLAPSVVFVCLSAPVFSMIQSVGRTDIPVKIMVPALVLKTAGNIMLISVKELNITGAAVSTAVCYIIISVSGISYLKKICCVRIESREVFFNPVYAGLMCAGTAWIFRRKAGCYISEELILMLLTAACGAAVYIFVLILLGDSTMMNFIKFSKKSRPDQAAE